MTFDVPTNWEEIGSYTANGFLYNQFYMENGSLFMYAQAEYLGTDSMKASDLESMTSTIGLSSTTYEDGYKIGSNEYVLIRGTFTGGNANTPASILAYLEKGYLYFFWIMSSYNGVEYKSAIRLIESIDYPINPNYRSVSTNSSSILEKGLGGGFVALILMGGVAIFGSIKKKATKPTSNPESNSNTFESIGIDAEDNSQIAKGIPSAVGTMKQSTPIDEIDNTVPSVKNTTENAIHNEKRFCQKCGARLSVDANFCPLCGLQLQDRKDNEI